MFSLTPANFCSRLCKCAATQVCVHTSLSRCLCGPGQLLLLLLLFLERHLGVTCRVWPLVPLELVEHMTSAREGKRGD